MTTKEMMHAVCPNGYWFVNVAPLGEKPDWQLQVAPHKDNGFLFGYEEQAFMRKQYK